MSRQRQGAAGTGGRAQGRTVRAALNNWFRRPPRLHGEVDHDRTVSFLELFYDLVFVVLVGQAAHTLAEHATWRGLADFVVVFSLIWIAWLNGSLHHEGHGREDGRGRGNIFGQMMILVLLAVFTAHATDDDGRAFALTYTALLAWIAWQWDQVRRRDVVAVYQRIAGGYLVMLLVSIAVMCASALAPGSLRFWFWVVAVVINVCVPMWSAWRAGERPLGLMPTESLAERFGLLTIIVLGEVVVGVVGGINSAPRGSLGIVTGLLALGVGFGFWWNYFDLLGRRPPRPTYPTFFTWVLLHLPLTMVIAGAGAGMVGLIHHAHESRSPVGPAWLLAGASAAMLVIVAALTTLMDYEGPVAAVLTHARRSLLTGAVASLATGLALPSPWLLATLLAGIHQAVWWYVFVQLARHTDAFTW